MAQAPSARDVDQLADDICRLQDDIKTANELLDEKKAQALKLVEAHGRCPDTAAKSRRLEGELYELTATFGQTTKILPKSVEQLEAQLREDGQHPIFSKLFMVEKKYMVAPAAELFLAKLSKKAHRFYLGCVRVVQKKPTVSAKLKAGMNVAAAS